MLSKFVPKVLQKQTYRYYSDQSPHELQAAIKEVINKGFWDFSVNLMGEFTSEFEFTLTPKWQSATFSGRENKTAYLYGRIHPVQPGRTEVIFTVRSNTVTVLFFFIFPIGGLVALFSGLIDETAKNRDDLLAIGISFILIVPPLALALGYSATESLKKRFISVFGLRPSIDNDVNFGK